MLAISMATSSPHFAPAHKRPKLSLQTNSLPSSYPCQPTSFSTVVMAAAVATPTAMNTFNNTYDLTHRPTHVPFLASNKPAHPPRSQSSRRTDRPQHVQYGVKSILKNAELQTYATVSPVTSSRKVLFPQPKKVGFKRDLEEEIITKVYTAKHSDLAWEDDEMDVLESVEQQSEDDNTSTTTVLRSTQKPRRDSGICLKVNDVSKVARSSKTVTQSSSLLQSKKKRRWEWTLSPDHAAHTTADLDTSDLDSEWVIVSVSRPECHKQDAESRPTKRRAASVDSIWNGSIARAQVVRLRKRANSL